MMTLRNFEPETDYPVICGWWEAHGWPPVHVSALPRLGLVAMNGEEMAAAAWAYMDNSVAVAFLEWIVTNPGNRAAVSVSAIHHVTNCLKECLAAEGYTAIHSSCRQPALARLLEKSGFVKTDSNIIHLVSIN